jgi:hypothetical protein
MKPEPPRDLKRIGKLVAACPSRVVVRGGDPVDVAKFLSEFVVAR